MPRKCAELGFNRKKKCAKVLVACATNFSDKGFTLEQKFMGRWVALTYRATHAYMAERLRKFEIGYGQFPFLCYLNRCGTSSQEEIARALVFDKATTARAIKKLEGLGYVERKVCSADHRRYEVKVTEAGANVAREIKSILRDWNERLTSGFDSAEKKMAFELLVRISGNAAAEIERLHILAVENTAVGGK